MMLESEFNENISSNDWKECIYENTLKYYVNRQVVIWGVCESGKKLKHTFEKLYGIDGIFFVDEDTQKQNFNGVFSPDILKNNASKYYVVVAITYDEDIVNRLRKWGFVKNKDYYYFYDCIKEKRDNYYEDYHGNRIYGNYLNLKAVFYGFNSTIKIDDNVELLHSKMVVGNNVSIEIGSESLINEVEFIIRDNSKLEINQGCRLSKSTCKILHDSHMAMGENVLLKANGKIIVHENADLTIGAATTFESGVSINVNQYSAINIGKDCMFSIDVCIWNNSRHSIFDVVRKQNISSSIERCKNSSVDIGDHVWLGYGTFVFEGSSIGSGSIIGAKAFINSKIPNNCIAVGPPLKIVRKNIAWSRKDNSENIEDCGHEYIQLTCDI